MPAYSFQSQFIPKIQSGEKTHTIRGKRTHLPRVGQRFVAYYAMRTKQCRKLLESTITHVDDIQIIVDNQAHAQVFINGEKLAADEREALARRDGFENWRQMADFWNGQYPFSGDMIHWKAMA